METTLKNKLIYKEHLLTYNLEDDSDLISDENIKEFIEAEISEDDYEEYLKMVEVKYSPEY